MTPLKESLGQLWEVGPKKVSMKEKSPSHQQLDAWDRLPHNTLVVGEKPPENWEQLRKYDNLHEVNVIMAKEKIEVQWALHNHNIDRDSFPS